MIDISVPVRSSSVVRHWHGGRTTIFDLLHHHMTALRRISWNPCSVSVRQTSAPNSTQNLGNRYIDMCHIDFGVEPAFDFFGWSLFVEQL